MPYICEKHKECPNNKCRLKVSHLEQMYLNTFCREFKEYVNDIEIPKTETPDIPTMTIVMDGIE